MPSSWNRRLKQELKNLVKNKSELEEAPLPRIVVIGIGNVFKSDDAVGPVIIKRLLPSLKLKENLLILDAGVAPENHTGTLRRFAPDFAILIDAVDMGTKPGAIAWVEWDSLADVSGFTHASAPAMLGEFLNKDIQCQIGLIGIQPFSLTFDGKLSKEIKAAATKVVVGLKRTLTSIGY